jgi:phage baseplate assembly protein W
MAVTRADSLTSTIKKQTTYSDFLTSFAKSPFSGQLVTTKNDDSIKQSLKNLIMTNYGERFFNPTFGSEVYSSLFEPLDQTDLLVERITYSIDNFEPRVQLVSIDQTIPPVTVSAVGDHELQVTITFNTINNITPITLDFILKRVR